MQMQCKITHPDMARMAYMYLKWLSTLEVQPAKKGIVENEIVNLKRELRRWSHEKDDDRRIVKYEGIDGYVALVKLPAFLVCYEKETVEKWFDEKEVIRCSIRPYQTGEAFTRWYHIFKRSGLWYAYHAVGYDI